LQADERSELASNGHSKLGHSKLDAFIDDLMRVLENLRIGRLYRLHHIDRDFAGLPVLQANDDFMILSDQFWERFLLRLERLFDFVVRQRRHRRLPSLWVASSNRPIHRPQLAQS